MAKQMVAKKSTRGLGKGLSALMSESYGNATEEARWVQEGQGAEQTLPLDSIQPGKYQPREYFDEGMLSQLAESVRRNGVLQPILVRPLPGGRYEIVAGERRWRAARMAGLTSIPVLIRDLRDDSALEIALVENVQRQDLTPLEESAGYQRLIDEFNYTQETLAGIVGKSRSHVTNMLRLLSLPQDIRQMLNEEKLTMGHARALMGLENASQLAHDVIRRGLNVRQTEKLANTHRNGPLPARRPRRTREEMMQAARAAAPVAPPPQAALPAPQQPAHNGPRDPDIMALEETLSENLGLKVSISDRGQSGEIMIAYDSLEQLDEILRRLGGAI